MAPIRRRLHLVSLLLALVVLPVRAQAPLQDPCSATRAFFQLIADKNFSAAWNTLSQHCQQVIVRQVAQDEHMPPTRVRYLFEKNDTRVQDGFWKEVSSGPMATYASECRFKLLLPGTKTAVVTMVHGVATRNLTLVNEGGTWKVNLVDAYFPNGFP